MFAFENVRKKRKRIKKQQVFIFIFCR